MNTQALILSLLGHRNDIKVQFHSQPKTDTPNLHGFTKKKKKKISQKVLDEVVSSLVPAINQRGL